MRLVSISKRNFMSEDSKFSKQDYILLELYSSLQIDIGKIHLDIVLS